MDSAMNPSVVLTSVDLAMDSLEVKALIWMLGHPRHPSMRLKSIQKIQKYVTKMKKIFLLMSKLTRIDIECDYAIFKIHTHFTQISKNMTSDEKISYHKALKKHYHKKLGKLLLQLYSSCHN